MNEALNQKISQLIDDELDADQALRLLQKIQADTQLRETFNRYQAIGQAMKTETFVPVSAGFSERIALCIAEEPVYLLPHRKSARQYYKRVAIAASVVVVSIFAAHGIYRPFEPNTATTNLQLAQHEPKVLPPAAPAKNVDNYPLNARISDYLKAHNNTLYANTEADFKPWAKVTAYNPK